MRVAHEPLSEIGEANGRHRRDDRQQCSPAEDKTPVDRVARRVLKPFDVFANRGHGVLSTTTLTVT